ncbi:MAG TPA: ABC transporter ATP-binding protein [Candidatus Limnocylindria bacterium]|nr:ABC transporter ATP-binding protein [Candidatus Limnocylindria bacterium]
MADKPKIVIEGVTKTFRTRKQRETFVGRFMPQMGHESVEVTALDGLNLTVPEGRFAAIVGPSGCGKTTALRMMDGLAFPDSGKVLVNGTPVTGPRRECGFVFQDFGLYPWRCVLDNVAFGPELQGVPRDERYRMASANIELVGLKGFEQAFPHQLSGGMQQRVGIARMLTVEPEIMLMDEPFGALDALTRRVMQFELIRILSSRETATSVFVTHDLDEAILLGDIVIVMTARPGRVKEVVEVKAPRNERNEAFLETPAFAELRHHLWLSLAEEQAPSEERLPAAAAS